MSNESVDKSALDTSLVGRLNPKDQTEKTIFELGAAGRSATAQAPDDCEGGARSELPAALMRTSPLGLPEASELQVCLLYTSPSPRDRTRSRMPSSA